MMSIEEKDINKNYLNAMYLIVLRLLTKLVCWQFESTFIGAFLTALFTL